MRTSTGWAAGLRLLLAAAALVPFAKALADSGCASAAQLIDSVQEQHQPLPAALETAQRAVAQCDVFATQLFLAQVLDARHAWLDAQVAFERARSLAGADQKKVDLVDLQLAMLEADQGPPCKAVAALDSAARRLADHEASLPEWFTKRRMALESKWTESGLPAQEIACTLNARKQKSVSMRQTRLFCSEVSMDIPVYFDVKSSQLDASAQHQVDAIAQALKPLLGPKDRVRIDGHTDEQGASAYNQPLSQQRAASVASALASRLQLRTERFPTVGHGSQQPKYAQHTPEAYRLNRRVEITLLPPECGP
jgi:outer membrane protein OmpA-like peptidoglycan-associated protein